jgi:ferredoxin
MSPTITYNGQAYPLDPNKTLLENLETQAVSVEFHCRDGHCGACRSTIKSGTVNYINPPLVYLKENEILLCCSKSKSDIIINTP